MSKKVEQAVRILCDDVLTPGFFAGIRDKTVDKRSSFWRANVFNQPDIVHDKDFMFWAEMQERYPHLMPTDICPCDEPDMIATNDSYVSKAITMGYWSSGFPVDCDFTQFLRPGENPFASRSFDEAVAEYFVKLRDRLFRGYDQKEEMWSFLLATKGSVTIEPKGGKPYVLEFKRDKDLELTVDSGCEWCTEKGEKNNADPYADIVRMNDALFDKNRGGLNMIVMNRQTCNWLKQSMAARVKDCPELAMSQFLSPTSTNFATNELPPKFDGARLDGIMPIGQQNVMVYCAETSFQFCDPDTGIEVCVNGLEDGKVYGYNTDSSSDHAFKGVWMYGRIRNHFAEETLQKRFFRQYIEPSGKSMKYIGESAPSALVECPNGSVCLDVCPTKK